MVKTKISVKKSPIVSDKQGTPAKTAPSAVKKRPASDHRKMTGSRITQAATQKINETPTPSGGVVSATGAATDPLDRAEKGLNAAIDALNLHMNAALGAVAEIVQSRGNLDRSGIRTTPLDRASAAFRRLIADVVDHQFAEILPPLVALRNEIAGYSSDSGTSDGETELRTRVLETLNHVFALAGVETYEARAGESFDSLIHLAVGQAHRNDLANGSIAEQFQPGFRFLNGRIISPAKVSINRR